jgi:hypothetical protein
MTEIIRYSSTGKKFRIIREAEPLSIIQIQTGTYPVYPITKTDIFKMDYEELKQYSFWKAQNTIITNNKKFLALCRRANLMCSSGQIGQREWRNEHMRIFSRYGIEEEDIEKEETRGFFRYLNMYKRQIEEHRANQAHLKPILVRKFTSDLKRVSEYTYDYAAHWKARGYKAEHWMLREAKSTIVRILRCCL